MRIAPFRALLPLISLSVAAATDTTFVPDLGGTTHELTLSTTEYYLEENGFAIVDVEELDYSDAWELQDDRSGFAGEGYLRWIGGTQGQGGDQEVDHTGELQGDPGDWLVFPVRIENTGEYAIDLYNTHEHKDGDNDIWCHMVGEPGQIDRQGDWGVKVWQWLSWGPEWVTFDISEPGLYYFYVTGRSNGFAIDKMAVFRKDADYKDSNAPFAEKVTSTSGLRIARPAQHKARAGSHRVRIFAEQSRQTALSFDPRGRRTVPTATVPVVEYRKP